MVSQCAERRRRRAPRLRFVWLGSASETASSTRWFRYCRCRAVPCLRADGRAQNQCYADYMFNVGLGAYSCAPARFQAFNDAVAVDEVQRDAAKQLQATIAALVAKGDYAQAEDASGNLTLNLMMNVSARAPDGMHTRANGRRAWSTPAIFGSSASLRLRLAPCADSRVHLTRSG
jgi:hypothetical protein